MTRPRVFELFCCEGGMHTGLTSAGFDVYGLDIFEEYSQARYPGASFKGDFSLAMVRLLSCEQLPFTHKDGRVEWLGRDDFVAVHMSPPCQHASAGTRSLRQDGKQYEHLIEPSRWLAQQTGLPYSIENVSGAALIDPEMLCGSHFDMTATDADGFPLRLERHRLFETSFPLTAPGPCKHDPNVWAGGVYGGARKSKVPKGTPHFIAAPMDRYEARYVRKGGYVPRSLAVRRELLGIDWMTAGAMNQAVPPRYGQHVGEALMAHLTRLEVAA